MVQTNRRTFNKAAGAIVASAALGGAIAPRSVFAEAHACEEWRSGTLQIMAPAAPGGGWDTTAREMQRALQDEGIVDTVEVFNVEGAGGTIGLAELASQHSGDGHMAMIMGLVMIGGIGLNQAPVGLDQSTPIARLTAEFEVIVVPADSPHQTIDDLMAAFAEDPGAVSWAGGSAGGTDHLLVGLIAQDQGIDTTQINYVPFSGGGEALSAILGGQTTAGVSGIGEWQSQIETGELRALAVSGRTSTDDGGATPEAGGATPVAAFGADIPTLQESGIDVELANWRGIVAPPELSEEDVHCLDEAIAEAVQSETWRSTLELMGWTDYYAGREEFTGFIEEEIERVNAILIDLQLLEGD
jgi:putative tricarboxylic transport membrane protein